MKLDLQFFGGRGSDSDWGAPPPSNTSRGANDTKSTTSLISARETKQKEVDQVLNVARDVTDEYGVPLEDIRIATMKPQGMSTLGYYDNSGNLAINSAFFNSEKMDATYDATVGTGFHPSRGNKSGLEAVAAHEMGHALTEKAAGSFSGIDRMANKIVKEAGKSLGYKKFNEFAGKISGYAKDCSAETISEAFCDVYCNGSRASKESQAVVNTLKNYLK